MTASKFARGAWVMIPAGTVVVDETRHSTTVRRVSYPVQLIAVDVEGLIYWRGDCGRVFSCSPRGCEALPKGYERGQRSRRVTRAKLKRGKRARLAR